jgi:hypothetical protein
MQCLEEEKKIELKGRKNLLNNQEKFIKNLLFTSTTIIKNSDFEEYGMHNRNLMFFLNLLTDKISSISMLGCRNKTYSLTGKISNFITYYEEKEELTDSKELKEKTIPKEKIKYIKGEIKNSKTLDEKLLKKYVKFLDVENDKDLVENLKLIYKSLIDNKYFETISDKIYEFLKETEINNKKFDLLEVYTNEYISLLLDYVQISIFQIKSVLRDSFRTFFREKNEEVFFSIFSNLTQSYKNENDYYIYLLMDKDFDDYLVTALKQSKNNKYILFSKTGLKRILESDCISNKKQLNEYINEYCNYGNNNYFLAAELHEKDVWKAIKKFRQEILQPFIGSMLYSGIKVKECGEYIVVTNEHNSTKKFINKYTYYDDVFKPLSQDRTDYSDVFKRYVIDQQDNEITSVIDEAVQLLPYYNTSNSVLIKFSNTWFALETLFRNADLSISKSLKDYTSHLIADKMISGFIYVSAIQIKKTYYGFSHLSSNWVENIFLNYDSFNEKDCDFIEWKFYKIKNIVDKYEDVFKTNLQEAQELLDNAYRLRNKQFHGKKNSQLENMSGFLYDIVNDTISFYIDFLDVYKENNPNLSSLYNSIKNIKNIKISNLENTDNYFKKICILHDSIRKI